MRGFACLLDLGQKTSIWYAEHCDSKAFAIKKSIEAKPRNNWRLESSTG